MHRSIAASIALLLTFVASPAVAGDVVDVSTYGRLLESYVDDEGRIDYERWAEDESDRKRLDDFLSEVAEASLEGHDRDEKLAFYLNAYNALVIDAILDEWPTDGPKSIEGFFEETTYRVAGKSTTLDHLEHGIVRPTFEEPRIHFVLVCAARSCPPLLREPLTGDRLEAQLASATESFVPAATEMKEGRVVTSKLFDWFAEDFEASAGSVRAYLARYVDGTIEEKLRDENVEIDFRSYDWSLNDW